MDQRESARGESGSRSDISAWLKTCSGIRSFIASFVGKIAAARIFSFFIWRGDFFLARERLARTVTLGTNLAQLVKDFGSDTKCREYLEVVRRPVGPICPRCHGSRLTASLVSVQPGEARFSLLCRSHTMSGWLIHSIGFAQGSGFWLQPLCVRGGDLRVGCGSWLWK
jgi:hypothetical protein